MSLGMMPERDIYGEWPASGEIDIVESRGNDVHYPMGGRDIVSSSIHWGEYGVCLCLVHGTTANASHFLGPTPQHNAFWRSTRGKALRRTDYSEGFHTFGLEWTEDHIFTYIDSPLRHVMYWKFQDTMWQLGHFGGIYTKNGSLLVDPWSHTGEASTPFDQPFFLILNVAVGSRNGWFPDGIGGKPWTDQGPPADFYNGMLPRYHRSLLVPVLFSFRLSLYFYFFKARTRMLVSHRANYYFIGYTTGLDTFYPTWPEDDSRGMTIRSVRMWQEGTCG